MDAHKRRRFASAFDTPSVNMVRVKDNIFVMLNSIAFEGDYCDMCREAEKQLADITEELSCAQVQIYIVILLNVYDTDFSLFIFGNLNPNGDSPKVLSNIVIG